MGKKTVIVPVRFEEDVLSSVNWVSRKRKWNTSDVLRTGTELFIRLEQEDAMFLLGNAVVRLTDIKEECERVGADDWVRKVRIILENLAPVQEALRI